MTRKIEKFIAEQGLLLKDGLYIVALSGGADSVALLRCLLALGYRIEAAHCNFHLRGEESDRDEQFVIQLCQQLEVPLHLAHFDTRSYAQLHKVSIEMAARELRYHYFEQLRQDIGATDICVAHHQDDSVETLLINLIRGTGIHGLTGIRPRQGHIVRPLLCVSRMEIEEELKKIGQSYITDSTNLIDDVVRNKIRLNILPQLREINPSVAENIFATSQHISEAERLYDAAVKAHIRALTGSSEVSASGCSSMRIADLLALPSPESILFEWLQAFSFQSQVIEQVFNHLSSQTGSKWSSPTHDLILNRGEILVEPHQAPIASMKIPEAGCYMMGEKQRFRFTLSSDLQVIKTPDHACLDAAKVTFPLTIRTVQEGDRFVPFGMKGSKLVSDFLTDQKCTIFERRRQLVITDASDTIVWLVGRRPDQRFCISETTTQMLVCHYSDHQPTQPA